MFGRWKNDTSFANKKNKTQKYILIILILGWFATIQYRAENVRILNLIHVTIISKGGIALDWLTNMNNAVEYIENNLDDEIDYGKAARIACCSVYNFQRIFSFITNIPIAEYIRRRRLTLAAFEFQTDDVKVIDIALKYGYESPESFTRAFQSVHGITPTAAREKGARIKAYPRISFQFTIKGDSEMNYRIINKPPFNFYGIERIFDTANGENLTAIPQFWSEISEKGEMTKLYKSANYPTMLNAVCGYRDVGLTLTSFPYLIGCLQTPLSDTDGYTVIEIPASTWAVFENEPHTIEMTSTETQKLISRVFTDWLPTAKYREISGFDIEMYHMTNNGLYYEEFWIRVEKI